MKLSEATALIKMNFLAELDGFHDIMTSGPFNRLVGKDVNGTWQTIPNYYYTYDAIIPLVLKHWDTCSESTYKEKFNLGASRDDLINYLLLATGKLTL